MHTSERKTSLVNQRNKAQYKQRSDLGREVVKTSETLYTLLYYTNTQDYENT